MIRCSGVTPEELVRQLRSAVQDVVQVASCVDVSHFSAGFDSSRAQWMGDDGVERVAAVTRTVELLNDALDGLVTGVILPHHLDRAQRSGESVRRPRKSASMRHVSSSTGPTFWGTGPVSR